MHFGPPNWSKHYLWNTRKQNGGHKSVKLYQTINATSKSWCKILIQKYLCSFTRTKTFNAIPHVTETTCL